MKFKKGELTKESFEVLMYDLECLDLTKEEGKISEFNKYHLSFLKGNLKDIFGIK